VAGGCAGRTCTDSVGEILGSDESRGAVIADPDDARERGHASGRTDDRGVDGLVAPPEDYFANLVAVGFPPSRILGEVASCAGDEPLNVSVACGECTGGGSRTW